MLDPELLTRSDAWMLKYAAGNAGRYVAGVSQRPSWEGFVENGLARLDGPRREAGLTAFMLTEEGVKLGRKLAKGRAS